MTYFDYSNAAYPIRGDIADAYRAYWRKLAAPGSWWNGAQRIAIAQESRNALACTFCAQRKVSLSPYGLKGEHDHSNGLPEVAVDTVHRIITDQSRICLLYTSPSPRD